VRAELPADEHFEAGGETTGARIRSYAETGAGCHSVALPEALRIFHAGNALHPPAKHVPPGGVGAGTAGWAESADPDADARPGPEPEPPEHANVPLVWIDVERPGDDEAAFLRDELHFHPLAVEDCLRGRQRPKLDRYPGYYFMVLYTAHLNGDRKRIALHEVHLFVGRHYVVTVHDHPIPELREVLARWRSSPHELRTSGAVAHALIDAIVDDYFPMLDHFAERVDEVEAGVFAAQNANMKHILGLRRELTLFRKVVGPERDLLGTLLRRDVGFLGTELSLYFQDVHDHAMRVVEEIDTLRDLLSVALEGQLSMSSNQLNVTMRVMAAWSIILMAITLVAGIYGMNFHIMPELAWHYGYAFALGLMAFIGVALIAYFRHRRWI
jgi:magnesium transporter